MKIKLLAAFVVATAPLAAGAHIDNPADQDPGFRMMQQIEDRALGDELHGEMEDLMLKMMSGELSQTEADRMIELMDQYPGPSSMMMGRMMNAGMFGAGLGGFGGDSMMGYGFGGPGGGILMILFWIAVIAGIVVLITYAVRSKENTSVSKSAFDILQERYAGGEIDKEEFESKRKDLRQ